MNIPVIIQSYDIDDGGIAVTERRNHQIIEVRPVIIVASGFWPRGVARSDWQRPQSPCAWIGVDRLGLEYVLVLNMTQPHNRLQVKIVWITQ